MIGAVGVGVLGCGEVGSAVVRRLAAGDVPGAALRRVAVRDVHRARRSPLAPGVLVADARAVVDDPEVDVVVELMGGLEPAAALWERALALGKAVVTANKAVLGADGAGWRRRADAAGVPLGVEAAVAGAVPIVRALPGVLAAGPVTRVDAVLNGTTTFVLDRMERTGDSLAEAVAAAQALGYAEADPARDLDGTDAADKIALLAQLLWGDDLRTQQVHRLGIGWLDRTTVAEAAAAGHRWRLVATAVPGGCARVEPRRLPLDHPLARLDGADNGLLVRTAQAGTLTFTGPGAGGEATAASVVADLRDVTAWCARRREAPAGLVAG